MLKFVYEGSDGEFIPLITIFYLKYLQNALALGILSR